jgi:hypothetical protein
VTVLRANPSSGLIETMSVVAVVAMPLVIPGLVWLAGWIYRNAVMRSGARVTLADARRRP